MSTSAKGKFWKHYYVVQRDGEEHVLESPRRQAPDEQVAIYKLVEVKKGRDIESDMDQMMLKGLMGL